MSDSPLEQKKDFPQLADLKSSLEVARLADAEYENGRRWELENKMENAVHCYKLAAEKNNLEAMYLLARCYEHGRGVGKNLQEASKLYEQSADVDKGEVLQNLANYFLDEGYKKNPEESLQQAMNYFSEAIELGCNEAYIGLGDCYRLQFDKTTNLKQAQHYYQEVQRCYKNAEIAGMEVEEEWESLHKDYQVKLAQSFALPNTLAFSLPRGPLKTIKEVVDEEDIEMNPVDSNDKSHRGSAEDGVLPKTSHVSIVEKTKSLDTPQNSQQQVLGPKLLEQSAQPSFFSQGNIKKPSETKVPLNKLRDAVQVSPTSIHVKPIPEKDLENIKKSIGKPGSLTHSGVKPIPGQKPKTPIKPGVNNKGSGQSTGSSSSTQGQNEKKNVNSRGVTQPRVSTVPEKKRVMVRPYAKTGRNRPKAENKGKGPGVGNSQSIQGANTGPTPLSFFPPSLSSSSFTADLREMEKQFSEKLNEATSISSPPSAHSTSARK